MKSQIKERHSVTTAEGRFVWACDADGVCEVSVYHDHHRNHYYGLEDTVFSQHTPQYPIIKKGKSREWLQKIVARLYKDNEPY